MSRYVDISRFPIVVLQTPVRFTPEEVTAYHEAISSFVAARSASERWATIVDVRHVERVPDAVQRRSLSAHAQHMEHATQGRIVATALVVQNPVVRAALTAVFWVYRTEVPRTTVATMAAAERWCAERLEEAR